MVPKPRSDKWRLVIDYRYVNTLVQDDSYVIPNISDLLISLSGSKFFSIIDLNWGFWNISLEEASKQFTGFAVPGRGVFVWNVMPFGLKSSPTIFQRAIEKSLREVIDVGNVHVYIDDIIIHTIDIDVHLTLIEKVFSLLRKGGFYINFEKLRILQEEVLFLGHLIGFNQLKPDPAKIEAIVKARPPTEKKGVKSFCAASTYLKNFIPRFSELLEPLTRLTAKNVRFKWELEQEEAFMKIKTAMIEACYLTMPDWNKDFIIFTDASEVAVAAVLTQLNKEEDNLNFIEFGSKKLTYTQRNWSPTERELFAIVWACERFDQYIKGSRPLIYSDHKSLSYLAEASSPKVRRWAIRLSEYRPHITHLKGEANGLADWLSRSIPEREEKDKLIPKECYVPAVYHLVHQFEKEFTLPDPQEMTVEAKREEEEMKSGTLDWFGGVAYSRIHRRMYVPEKFRPQILLWFHCSKFGGHQGILRTTNRIKKMLWWPNLQKTVADFINSCPVCNAFKPLPLDGGVEGSLSKPQLFQLVSLDFVGPRRHLNRRYYILIIIDHYSRYMVTVVTDTIKTPVAENAFRDHWLSKFGSPKFILCDRGTAFTCKSFVTYVREEAGSALLFASHEYPQGNGINESSHRILETAIRTNEDLEGKSIEQVVAEATLLYNCSPNRSLGDTPSSLTFGCDLHLPGLELLEPEESEEKRLQILRDKKGLKYLSQQLKIIQQNEFIYDKDKIDKFEVGDIITYKLKINERKRMEHASREEKYRARRSFPYRVVKVSPNNLTAVPLWTRGLQRTVPRAQCKRVASFVPEALRKEAMRLYPKAPWNPEKCRTPKTALPGLGPEELDLNTDMDGSEDSSLEKVNKKRLRTVDPQDPPSTKGVPGSGSLPARGGMESNSANEWAAMDLGDLEDTGSPRDPVE